MDIFFIFFLIFILLVLLSIMWSAMSLAPFVPMRAKDLKRVFALADLKPGEIFYDLGCGNAKVVIYAARNYQVKAIGIEFAWPVWFFAKLRQIISRQKNAEVKFGNLFHQDLSQASVVYFFGMPDTIKNKLKTKLEKELKPGTRVISYAFSVPGWQAEMIDKPSKKDISIYLYKR